MSPFQIRRLSYRDIEQITNSFLGKFHPQKTLPIPIEEIAESELELEIVPVSGMKREYDVDGCLDSSLKRIFIDFDIYMTYENRSRFTIAHEIGHLIIHKELFESLLITKPEDVYNLSEKISDEDNGWLEFQAYSFAGQVLVPKQLLEIEIKKYLGSVPQNSSVETMYSMVQDLASNFNVSGDVILKRLQKDGFVKSNS